MSSKKGQGWLLALFLLHGQPLVLAYQVDAVHIARDREHLRLE